MPPMCKPKTLECPAFCPKSACMREVRRRLFRGIRLQPTGRSRRAQLGNETSATGTALGQRLGLELQSLCERHACACARTCSRGARASLNGGCVSACVDLTHCRLTRIFCSFFSFVTSLSANLWSEAWYARRQRKCLDDDCCHQQEEDLPCGERALACGFPCA